MTLHRMERDDVPEGRPLEVLDPTLTTWSNYQALLMLEHESVNKLLYNHLMALMMEQVMPVSATLNKNPTHMMLQGPAGLEKSQAVEMAMRPMVPEGLIWTNHQSKLAFATNSNKSLDYAIEIHDEADPIHVHGPKQLSSEQRTKREFEKTRYTSNVVAYERNAEAKDGSGRREREAVKRSAIRSLIICANECHLSSQDPMMTRLGYFLVYPYHRHDANLLQRVIAGSGSDRGMAASVQDMVQRKRDGHARLALVRICQDMQALPECSIDLMRVMATSSSELLRTWLPNAPDNSRANQRAHNCIAAMVHAKADSRVFFSLGSEMHDRRFDMAAHTYNRFYTALFAE